MVIGQVIGCLAGGPISDVIGRRRALLTFLSLSLIGWLILASASLVSHPDFSIGLLFGGRFLHGLADSLGVSPAIMYVSMLPTLPSVLALERPRS